MEYRDMLKDEIEQVFKVMAKVLSDISGIRSNGQYSATIEASTQELKNELDIDVEVMLGLTFNELVEYVNSTNISDQAIIMLADIFLEMGNSAILYNKYKAKLYLERSYDLFKIDNRNTTIFCLNKMDKVTDLANLIDTL